jgi:hypothetical protein
MYLLTTYEAWTQGNTVHVRIKAQEGSMARPERRTHVELITDSGVIMATGIESEGIEIRIP